MDSTKKGGGEGFRHNEINYLQEQNRDILQKLEALEEEKEEVAGQISACEEKDATLQHELQSEKDQIAAHTVRVKQYKSETTAKDEHVKVLAEQNKQMLGLLETEENKSKEKGDAIKELESKNRKLQKVANEYDAAKAEIERKVGEAKAKCAEIIATVKSQRGLNETLRANIQNTEAKTRVDIEALGQALQVVDQKNLEYLSRVNKQETKEQQLKSETETLKEEVEEVRASIDKLRKELEGDHEGRTKFERARGQVEMQIQALEVQADTLKKALSTAERANEQLQEENRTAGERSRETSDKVYALMDSLRLNQVELKKQEAENNAREKKILSLERQIQNVQAKIAFETDARVLAEQERKEAEQESVLLKKKNKKTEELITVSQQAQEKAEKEIHEKNEIVSSSQTQNAYLASRIDGQEEEKNSMRAEIKKVGDRTTILSGDNSRMRDEIDGLEEQVATITNNREQLVKELEYIKREDLDEGGRQRPILIQSTESDLLEKLQVNEFLFEAQQARNPVPPMIEKIAQLLAMLHDGQLRADQYLSDLSKSNALVSALRQRNMALFSRTQMFESFKTRALLRYVMNLVEGQLCTDLHLDSLSFGPRELNEMIGLMQRYDATDKVFVVTLMDNGLDEESVNLILQLIFALPYLRNLDLRKNCLTPEACKRIEEQLKTMEGVTGVIRTADQVMKVHSGNQLRLTIDVSEQIPKDCLAKEIDFTVNSELQHNDADPFLETGGGQSSNPWAKNEATNRGDKMKSTAGGQTGAGPGFGVTGSKRNEPVKTHEAVPDASATLLAAPSDAPATPSIGGPPVGLGGPGNVAALNKKAQQKGKNDRDRLPDPKKRNSRRAKAAPPAMLEHIPDERVLDKWQSGAVQLPPAAGASGRPSSSSRRSSSQASLHDPQQRREPNQSRSAASLDRQTQKALAAAGVGGPLAASVMERCAAVRDAMDRSSSMPTLRNKAATRSSSSNRR